MSTPRFYFPEPLQPYKRFALPDRLAHYMLRVLRLQPGAALIVFDGYGGQYEARLLNDPKGALETGEHKPREAELGGSITLIQGLPSSDKMDWIIEKASELGVTTLIPVAAQRSVLRLKDDRLEKRQQHWQRVAQSASEQCGRNRILHIGPLLSLKECLMHPAVSSLPLLVCHPEADQPLAGGLPSTGRAIGLLIGPEGGWSDEELTLARQHGATAVHFGQRILRTETAGLALTAAVSALMGWN